MHFAESDCLSVPDIVFCRAFVNLGERLLLLSVCDDVLFLLCYSFFKSGKLKNSMGLKKDVVGNSPINILNWYIHDPLFACFLLPNIFSAV